jgi:ABC-type sugar transport system substrate-binding protein
MMRKSILVVFLLVFAAVSVFGAGQAEESGTPTVAFSPGDMANPSQAFAAKMFQKHADEFGFKVIILDGKGDAQVQAQTVTNAIAQNVDAIYVNPNDVNAIIPSLQQVLKSEISL